MRTVYRLSVMRRGWPLVGLLLILILAACGGGGGAAVPAGTLDERLDRYEESLRAEATWLWDNMVYASTHLRPDSEHCADPGIAHTPVVMDETARTDDSVAALLTDRLDYAAELVEQARAQWEKHCAGEVNAAAAVSFLDSRLRPAFESLNLVRSSMSERATSAALNQ